MLDGVDAWCILFDYVRFVVQYCTHYNTRKSCCLRIGPRINASCLAVSLSDGTDGMRYLGIFIVRSRTFKCSLEHAKKSFYRAANVVFAKIGRVASEEVTLQLIKVKCLPVLLYGLEAWPLTKSDLQSLDFVINRFFMKLFTTKNIEIVKYCQEYFGFALPSVLWAKRVCEFESSFMCFCLLCNRAILIVFVFLILLPCLFGE